MLNHPSINPLPGQRSDPAPPAARWRGRGARRGGRAQALPIQRGLAPVFRAPTVPRLMGTSVAVQGMLNAELRGEGTGNPMAIFQSNRVTAII